MSWALRLLARSNEFTEPVLCHLSTPVIGRGRSVAEEHPVCPGRGRRRIRLACDRFGRATPRRAGLLPSTASGRAALASAPPAAAAEGRLGLAGPELCSRRRAHTRRTPHSRRVPFSMFSRSGPRFWDQWLDWSGVGSVVVDGDDDEEAETEDRCGAEGEDRPGGAAGAGDGDGPGGASRGSSEPDLCLEEAAAGQRGAGVRSRASGSTRRRRANGRSRSCTRRSGS